MSDPIIINGLSNVLAGLSYAVEGMRISAKAAADEIASVLESYAKDHHPWHNQTYATQDTTVSWAGEIVDDMIVIILTTKTDYSKFLETIKDGKYAWLLPAILENEGVIMGILQKHLHSIRKL